MAKLPPVNASVTEIRGAGTEDYGTIYPGELKWSGEAPAYVRERVLIETARGQLDQLEVAEAVIPTGLAEVLTGDEITIERGGAPTTRSVQSVEPQPDFGFLRLIFQNA